VQCGRYTNKSGINKIRRIINQTLDGWHMGITNLFPFPFNYRRIAKLKRRLLFFTEKKL